MKMIDSDHALLSVRGQCNVLELNRSGVYYIPEPKADEAILMNEIYETWRKRPIYGYRRITAVLQRKGYDVNHKRIYHFMEKMNIKALYPKKRTSIKSLENKVYPYLLKDMEIDRPNQVWATDITYIKLARGFVYLVALIDLYSRRIIAWELSNSLDTQFCLIMLQRALRQATPEIVNTDQGVQFTSKAWIEVLEKNGIKISMDGVERCFDNIYIERFWRSFKYEDYHLRSYENMPEARHYIAKYIEFYNNERPHSKLRYKTPTEVYFSNNLNQEDNYLRDSDELTLSFSI